MDIILPIQNQWKIGLINYVYWGWRKISAYFNTKTSRRKEIIKHLQKGDKHRSADYTTEIHFSFFLHKKCA
jgi:hypothetical protein